ncbi:hypothetical protein B4102_3675 [Heyndrickxia sporothermodurans]|uniref:Uncharacterized protein n=1 Tax=Heyndrickxia sporothermodurans TaxID=46224 RepID=A0A150KLS3_9BACI|nr:class I SAM-dependent methyltransferase [Heyndrickxia sporothermodurans]KYC94324.1 hypothetical protein B4102_3675 [Heyndrickxia sporothermodurans]
MLSKQGFDLWANDYDQTVQLSEENNQYPFAGYKEILNTIFNEVMQKPSSHVLDIGFGTGVLTTKLYEHYFSEYFIKVCRHFILLTLISWFRHYNGSISEHE